MKRAKFRQALAGSELLVFPGAFNGVSAKLIEDRGFDGVYISGAVIAADLGLPDIGLTTLTEVTTRATQITRATNLPTLVDADTGFGEVLNVARTVQFLEEAGVAGLHIEDQVNPKRCGHLDGKEVVGLKEAINRISAASEARRDPDLVICARTDVRALEGLDATIERAKAFVDAGADMVFPEALLSLEEFEKVAKAVKVPVLANMTEFGKGELYTHSQLKSAGVRLVIHPVSLLRAAMGASERALDSLKKEESLESQVPNMQTRARLYELLDYESYNRFDEKIFNFKLD